MQEEGCGARVKGQGFRCAGDHGSHARYTHHDEALSRAMENLPEVKEKGSPIGKGKEN